MRRGKSMASNGGSRSGLGLMRIRNIVAGLLGVLLFAGALFVALPPGGILAQTNTPTPETGHRRAFRRFRWL